MDDADNLSVVPPWTLTCYDEITVLPLHYCPRYWLTLTSRPRHTTYSQLAKKTTLAKTLTHYSFRAEHSRDMALQSHQRQVVFGGGWLLWSFNMPFSMRLRNTSGLLAHCLSHLWEVVREWARWKGVNHFTWEKPIYQGIDTVEFDCAVFVTS